MAYLTPARLDGELHVAVDDVPTNGALLQLPDMERPVLVRRGAGGAYVALLAECTHQGCQPDPVGDRLVCPCHGSEFDLEGAVLEGPADRPLPRYRTRVEGGQVIVTLRGGVR